MSADEPPPPVEPDVPAPPVTARNAVRTTALLFVAGFAGSTVAAVLVGAGLVPPTSTSVSWWLGLVAAVDRVATTLAVVALAIALARLQGVSPTDLGLRRPPTGGLRREVNLVALTLVTGFVMSVVMVWGFGSRGYVFPSGGGALAMVAAGAMAGPIEEIALLAVPVTLHRLAGLPWGRTVAVMVVLRTVYHLYYGWAGLATALFAAVMLIAYRRTGRALPLVVGHSLWDLLGIASNYGSAGLRGLLVLLLLTGLTMLAVVDLVHWLGRRHPHRLDQVDQVDRVAPDVSP